MRRELPDDAGIHGRAVPIPKYYSSTRGAPRTLMPTPVTMSPLLDVAVVEREIMQHRFVHVLGMGHSGWRDGSHMRRFDTRKFTSSRVHVAYSQCRHDRDRATAGTAPGHLGVQRRVAAPQLGRHACACDVQRDVPQRSSASLPCRRPGCRAIGSDPVIYTHHTHHTPITSITPITHIHSGPTSTSSTRKWPIRSSVAAFTPSGGRTGTHPSRAMQSRSTRTDNCSYLLEKSPGHTSMPQLMQYYFHANHTFFIYMLRHPWGMLGRAWDVWFASSRAHSCRQSGGFQVASCGEMMIHAWLSQTRRTFADLPYLNRIAVLHFEHFAEHNPQCGNAPLRLHLTPRSLLGWHVSFPRPGSCRATAARIIQSAQFATGVSWWSKVRTPVRPICSHELAPRIRPFQVR